MQSQSLSTVLFITLLYLPLSNESVYWFLATPCALVALLSCLGWTWFFFLNSGDLSPLPSFLWDYRNQSSCVILLYLVIHEYLIMLFLSSMFFFLISMFAENYSTFATQFSFSHCLVIIIACQFYNPCKFCLSKLV